MSRLLVDILCSTKATVSRSEARRLISTGGVKVNGDPVTAIDQEAPEEGSVQVGRKVTLTGKDGEWVKD